jgi:hypothetical protein
MLVAVVVLFVLCWAPLLILNVLYAYGVISKYSNDGDNKNILSAFTVMAYSNRWVRYIRIVHHTATFSLKNPF